MKLVGGLVAGWAAVSAGGLWHYMYQYSLPAAPASSLSHVGQHETLQGSPAVSIPLGNGQPITLLDFTSAECGCSQFVKAHVEGLEARYGKLGVRFVHVIEGEEKPSVGSLSVRDPHGVVARRFGVGATPGAVIVDSAGIVRYSGAYNRARFCDEHDSAFADLALKSILAGQTPAVTRTPFFGCTVPR